MSLFQTIAILLSLSAGLAWLNQRLIGLPATIGVMLLALTGSLALKALEAVGLSFAGPAQALLDDVNFNRALLDGMLGALLFAGALQIDLDDLKREVRLVTVLATAGLLASMLIVGGLMWAVFDLLRLDIAPVYCFLFGALISPTDPVAVLAILRRAGVPPDLETQFTGESLFNDGVAIVVFLTLAEFAGSGEATPGVADVAILFAREALGGIVFGLALGAVAYGLLKRVDAYGVEVMVTLALVTGGYAAADALGVSGPLAIVVAGLLVGNQGRLLAMSATTRDHLDTFWKLVDEILNAVLFMLIGLEILPIDFTGPTLAAGLLAIPAMLGARLLAVGIPVTLLRRVRRFAPYTVTILTWGGLRGGISVALALSLPDGHARDVLVGITYIAVVFSIGVQGLTIGRVARLARR